MLKLNGFLKKLFTKRSVLLAIFTMLIFAVICGIRRESILVIASLSLTLVYIIIYAGVMYFDIKKNGSESDSSFLSNLALNFLVHSENPIAVVSHLGEIKWFNTAFREIAGDKGVLYGKTLSEHFASGPKASRLRENSEPIPISLHGVEYEVSCYRTSSSEKAHCVTVWHDKTEIIRLKKEIEMKSFMVAFVVIDNFSEAVQFMQDKQRTALALIGSTLDAWTSSIGGIIKEYDRDKFVVIFEQRYMETLEENKFDILDKIREIKLDDIDMPFTASIGVSRVGNSLAEKESSARYALDMALQRGGDQAVVKTESSVEYYGGRTKSVQKKTKVRSRVIANELTNLIKQSGNVIVMGHRYADHDSIASCVAVSRLVKYLEKPVNVVVNIHDFNMKKIFESMRNMGDEYIDLFVDREMCGELIKSDTLLVVCDVNNPAFFEVPELYESANSFVIIDHHRKTGEYPIAPKINYVDPSASSVSEMMCEMLEQAVPPGTLLVPEANLLFAGMILDTKQFTKNTGVKTFAAAQYLKGEGADPQSATKLFSTNVTDFMRESLFENNIHIYKNKIAISVYEKEADQKDKIAASKAADRLLTVEYVCASFVLCTIDGSVHISSRSDGSVNVQLILEALGGGGHYDAAGAQLDGVTLEEALIKLKGAIDGYLEEATE